MTTRVLIVDDSPTAREALARAIEGEKGFEVVGATGRTDEAMRLIESRRPDVVTVDVFLDEEDGVELAARIMAERPTPILIVTGVSPRDPSLAFRAIRAGALDVFPKLPARTHPDYPYERQRLLRALSALAGVPMVTRRALSYDGLPSPAWSDEPRAPTRLVAIGASTGGPPVLHEILKASPIPVPVALVQHIADGFVETLAGWIASTTGRRVRVCDREVSLEPGTVIFAPARAHLAVTPAGTLAPVDGPPRNHQKPSIDVLFESAAQWLGSRAVGVLLSGMGSDGAAGLSRLRSAGALTIIQSLPTCAVDSMPRRALELGAACAELAPDAIAARLRRLAPT
ncbi:MAG: response regulator [Polyangiaceae bacterium]|nr:response regulator [Polyangiaceae bacterium]